MSFITVFLHPCTVVQCSKMSQSQPKFEIRFLTIRNSVAGLKTPVFIYFLWNMDVGNFSTEHFFVLFTVTNIHLFSNEPKSNWWASSTAGHGCIFLIWTCFKCHFVILSILWQWNINFITTTLLYTTALCL